MRNFAGVNRLARCVGFGGFVLASVVGGVSTLKAMEFSIFPLEARCDERECRRVVVAEGEIGSDAPAQFARFLRQELQVPGLHAMVFLNSPGGNVESALQLGALLHDAGAAVVVGRPTATPPTTKRRATSVGTLSVVPGHCASACVYALMGAKKRVVPSGARVGVHRMSARMVSRDPASGSTLNSRIFAGSTEINALRSYVSRVGGSQDLISLAESVPHDQIRILSGAEVRKYRLGAPSL
ncbi:MAG: periplasmic protein-like [Beijerinckiaceae bacterium]|nr:MAG: periplasmic protein-like [Beijerinckiaceae bacterium]